MTLDPSSFLKSYQGAKLALKRVQSIQQFINNWWERMDAHGTMTPHDSQQHGRSVRAHSPDPTRFSWGRRPIGEHMAVETARSEGACTLSMSKVHAVDGRKLCLVAVYDVLLLLWAGGPDCRQGPED